MGAWARLTAVAAVAGTGLAVVSGAAGWDTAHRVLAALALPPLAALAAIAWVSARASCCRRRSPRSCSSGSPRSLTGRDVHLAFASLALRARPCCSPRARSAATSSRARCATTSR